MDELSLVFSLTGMLNVLADQSMTGNDVLEWASPVPTFGDLSSARVATLGINPSNREFVSAVGDELDGAARRFHTLKSLGLTSWTEVDARQLDLMLDSFQEYFRRNPYDVWFKPLDSIIAGTGCSYYGTAPQACHLDLVPFATASKWSALTSMQRTRLLRVSGSSLGALLRDSNIEVLILNGAGVVREFEAQNGVALQRHAMPKWDLGLRSGKRVPGFAFSGSVDRLAGIELGRSLRVGGFNINLQSSHGVTGSATQAIKTWVSEIAKRS